MLVAAAAAAAEANHLSPKHIRHIQYSRSRLVHAATFLSSGVVRISVVESCGGGALTDSVAVYDVSGPGKTRSSGPRVSSQHRLGTGLIHA